MNQINIIPGKVGCSCGPDKPQLNQPPSNEDL